MTNFYTDTPRDYRGNLEQFHESVVNLNNLYNEFLENKSSYDSPLNNMGETLKTKHNAIIQQCLYHSPAVREQIVIDASDENCKVLTVRKGSNGHICFTDWLNVNMHVDTFGDCYGYDKEMSDYEYHQNCQLLAESVSHTLQLLLGEKFKITKERQTGLNFYKYSFVIGDNLGMVCIGGQRDTVMITLNGEGCTMAQTGWEVHMHLFLTTIAKKPKITRIDLAHDDINGDYLDIDWVDMLEAQDGFYIQGTRPEVSQLGNWKNKEKDTKGRTLNIGTRSNGKYVRFYERGKKFGDKLSKWVRCELELKAKSRIIPLDILLSPSDYFVGAYPAFGLLFTYETSKRIPTVKKQSKISFDKSFDIMSHQFGRYINYFKGFMSADEIVERISNHNTKVPERLRIHNYFNSVSQSTIDLYDFADSLKISGLPTSPEEYRELRKEYFNVTGISDASSSEIQLFNVKKNLARKNLAIEHAHSSLVQDMKPHLFN